MSVERIKNQITCEILPTYFKSLNSCTNDEDLVKEPTLDFLRQVFQLVFQTSNLQMVFSPIKNDHEPDRLTVDQNTFRSAAFSQIQNQTLNLETSSDFGIKQLTNQLQSSKKSFRNLNVESAPEVRVPTVNRDMILEQLAHFDLIASQIIG